jgi:tetratricopeptide (TPR) repeat protein
VVEADPRDTTALFNRGLALDRLGKREEAISDYGLVLDFEPQDADALLARGNILRDLRRTAEAIRDLKGAVDIAPTSAAASAARVILKDLGAADQVDREAKSLTGKAILHYIDAGDRVTIDILERTLRDEGIVVPRKELVPERVISGDVRYFYRGDLDMAVRAKQIVERALAKSGVRLTLDIKFLDANNIRFRSAPTGQIEIWLPSLSQAVNVRG